MPSQNKLIVPQPNLPQAPSDADGILSWTRQLMLVLDQYFSQLASQVVDHRMLGFVDKQPVADDFIIKPSQLFIDLYSVADVVSSAATAISMGVTGQWIVITNQGPNHITIKDAALTHLVGDIVLNSRDAIHLRWAGDLWIPF